MDRKRLWTLKLGANVSKDGVRFRVWAPNLSSLSLRILGNTTETPMPPEEKGYFTAFVNGIGTGGRYFYLLNGNEQRPDPASRSQPEGVHGPSEVIDGSAFMWEDRDWKGIPLKEMIIYEIHTGTFTREGTFDQIIPSLNYLKKELGVTAIELMPVAQFPGERNWGYDGTYPYAPQNSYGGPHGLKRLINACHRTGLAVILDVVYNHLGPEGNYLADFAPYFTDHYKSPWGLAMNYDGPGSDEVRRFVTDNALYWVTEYHIDGLRIDAIHGIFDFSARHILAEIREVVHRQGRLLQRLVAVIAESDLNDVRVINPPGEGGYGLDAQWNDDFHHSLHALIKKERNGYYQDFGGVGHLAKALRDGFVYSGQYSSYRKRRHGSLSSYLPPDKFIVFSQNHDQVGNRLRGDRLSTLVSLEALKLAAGTILLSPHIPLLFMGEEYGEEAPFQYFVSHSDPALIDAVRKGRKEELAAFQWEGQMPDPQDKATFLRSKLTPGLRRQGIHRILFDFYKTLIRLRKEIPSLAHLTKKDMDVKSLGAGSALFIQRKSEEDQVAIIFNFNSNPVVIPVLMEKGPWQKAFDSSYKRWGGPGATAPDSIQSNGGEISLPMEGYGFVLYRCLLDEV